MDDKDKPRSFSPLDDPNAFRDMLTRKAKRGIAMVVAFYILMGCLSIAGIIAILIAVKMIFFA